MRLTSILTGPYTHLDHLGVLSAVLDIPLIVTEEHVHNIAQKHYPDLQTKLVSLETLSMQYLADHFEAILESGKFFSAELGPFLQLLHGKKMRFVFCPHGNSDKGHSLKDHIEQDISLVYGDHLLEHLKENGAFKQMRHVVKTGNYRLFYYLKHQKFYDTLAQKTFFERFTSDKPYVLYAPTWSDEENPSSFFLMTEKLIAELSNEYNILIKLHPLLLETHPAHVFAICSRYDNHPSVQFLEDFAPIYPLLARCALYIGDYSSIGYDFLYFDKPLYFCNPLKSEKVFPLQTCGIEIPQNAELRLFLQKTQNCSQELSSQRRKIYRYAFGEDFSLEIFKKELFTVLMGV